MKEYSRVENSPRVENINEGIFPVHEYFSSLKLPFIEYSQLMNI